MKLTNDLGLALFSSYIFSWKVLRSLCGPSLWRFAVVFMFNVIRQCAAPYACRVVTVTLNRTMKTLLPQECHPFFSSFHLMKTCAT